MVKKLYAKDVADLERTGEFPHSGGKKHCAANPQQKFERKECDDGSNFERAILVVKANEVSILEILGNVSSDEPNTNSWPTVSRMDRTTVGGPVVSRPFVQEVSSVLDALLN